MKPANNAPIYLCAYAKLAEIARAHGYAMTVHGSQARDCDLICIPWVERPRRPIFVVFAIMDRFGWRFTGGPTEKPHGRIAYTLHLQWGDVYLDLQFMPAEAYTEGPLPAPEQ